MGEPRDRKHMQESARSNTVLFQVSAFLVGLAPTVALLVLAGCDDVERHRMMTMFFDGVPPLPGEMPQNARIDPNGTDAARRPRPGGWTVHEPVQDCTQCHGSRQRGHFSRKVHLVAEVPQLCHTCHEEDTTLGAWVHGPVATGDCLLCHEPHKTRTPFLLTKPVPALCYQCHLPEAVGLIERHSEESYAQCIDCHAGHAGPTKSLLRAAFLERPEGLEYRIEVGRRRYEEALRQARSDFAGDEDLSVILQKVVNALRSGQWWTTRAYLETALESDNVADAEKRKLGEVLRQVVNAQEAQSGAREPVPEASSLSDAAGEALVATLREIGDKRSKQHRRAAELYYQSINLYHAGRLEEAREGFLAVLESSPLPEPVEETARLYLQKIQQTLDTVDLSPTLLQK